MSKILPIDDGLVIYIKTDLNTTVDTIYMIHTNLLRVIIIEKNNVIFGTYRAPSTNLNQYITCINKH